MDKPKTDLAKMRGQKQLASDDRRAVEGAQRPAGSITPTPGNASSVSRMTLGKRQSRGKVRG